MVTPDWRVLKERFKWVKPNFRFVGASQSHGRTVSGVTCARATFGSMATGERATRACSPDSPELFLRGMSKQSDTSSWLVGRRTARLGREPGIYPANAVVGLYGRKNTGYFGLPPPFRE